VLPSTVAHWLLATVWRGLDAKLQGVGLMMSKKAVMVGLEASCICMGVHIEFSTREIYIWPFIPFIEKCLLVHISTSIMKYWVYHVSIIPMFLINSHWQVSLDGSGKNVSEVWLLNMASGSLICMVGPMGGYGACAYISIALPRSPFSWWCQSVTQIWCLVPWHHQVTQKWHLSISHFQGQCCHGDIIR